MLSRSQLQSFFRREEMTSPLPVVAGTLQTDPRSGGLKRSSGVNVLPSVAEGEFVSCTSIPFL
jgi:hypothetical protein